MLDWLQRLWSWLFWKPKQSKPRRAVKRSSAKFSDRSPSMHDSLFVFDIETIPDTDAVKALTGVESTDVGVLRKALSNYHLKITDGKNDFTRQLFHRVVAISFLEARIEKSENGERYDLIELRSGGSEGSTEQELLHGFFSHLEQRKARLVSYNGRGFDLPVLKYRAMKHGIAAPWFYNRGDKWSNYSQRYSADWHCDIAETVSDFGASARVRLNELCALLALPGKLGMDGADVAPEWDKGNIAGIRSYCETDVLNTYLVYLHLMQHRGTLSQRNFEAAIEQIHLYLETEGALRPHLQEFAAAWNALN